MHKFALLTLAAFLAFDATPVSAQTIIPYNVLQTCPGTSSSRTYTALDASNTSMTATAGSNGVLDCLGGTPGPGNFPGLFFGGNNRSARYSFSFSAPVTFVEFRFTAHSSNSESEEELGNFALDVGSYAASFTNVQGTTWDGFVLGTTASDGRAILGFTRTGGGSFNSIAFDFNVLNGTPNGSVIERMSYSLGGATAVPEPSTLLTITTGLIGIAAVARRRRRAH